MFFPTVIKLKNKGNPTVTVPTTLQKSCLLLCRLSFEVQFFFLINVCASLFMEQFILYEVLMR